jgi:hypothetical protein
MLGSRDKLLNSTLPAVMDYLCDVRLLFTDLELFIHDVDRVLVVPLLTKLARYARRPLQV